MTMLFLLQNERKHFHRISWPDRSIAEWISPDFVCSSILTVCFVDAADAFRNVDGYTPIHTMKMRIGTSTAISRSDRSWSDWFAGFVNLPNMTRWNIHSMYTAAKITPVAATIV